MIKKAAIVLGVVALIVFNLCTPDVDVPMSLHIFAWYIGVAIWFSLTVPMRTGRTLETLKDVGPMARVLVGLVWPIYMIVWFTTGKAAVPYYRQSSHIEAAKHLRLTVTRYLADRALLSEIEEAMAMLRAEAKKP